MRAAAPSAAGPARAAWVELGDDFGREMAEEMRHGEKAAAENARGDFRRSKRDVSKRFLQGSLFFWLEKRGCRVCGVEGRMGAYVQSATGKRV